MAHKFLADSSAKNDKSFQAFFPFQGEHSLMSLPQAKTKPLSTASQCG